MLGGLALNCQGARMAEFARRHCNYHKGDRCLGHNSRIGCVVLILAIGILPLLPVSCI